MPDCSTSTYPEFMQSEQFLKTTLHILTSLGLPIHAFGAFCILTKSPPQMAEMKWAMLNLLVWSVIFDVILGFFLIPFIQIPALGGVGLGILTDFKMNLGNQTFLGMAALGGLIVSVTILFETRFYLLYASHTEWSFYRRFWIVFNYFLGFFYLFPTYKDYPEQVQGKKELFEYIPCLPEFLLDDRFFIVTVHRGRVAMNIGVLVIPVPLEAILFVFMIYWNMRKMKKMSRLSEKTLQLQKRFLRSLILQVTLPVIILLVPIYLYEYAILSFHYNQGINNFGIIIISIHGTVSSIAMILLHKPYRETFFWYFRVRRAPREQAPRISQVVDTRL